MSVIAERQRDCDKMHGRSTWRKDMYTYIYIYIKYIYIYKYLNDFL